MLYEPKEIVSLELTMIYNHIIKMLLNRYELDDQFNQENIELIIYVNNYLHKYQHNYNGDTGSGKEYKCLFYFLNIGDQAIRKYYESKKNLKREIKIAKALKII